MLFRRGHAADKYSPGKRFFVCYGWSFLCLERLVRISVSQALFLLPEYTAVGGRTEGLECLFIAD
ncbi:hypothetical protein DXA36_10155 [Eisenbergiella sp. OF01-20]|nr:hypothetical protein DXA36_10155 [Eisenbergiella sp. OF01-20]